MKLRSTEPSAPLKTWTWGPPPGPAPVIISGTPSPLISAVATKMPPVNRGSYAMKLRRTEPSVPLKTWTWGPPPGPAPVMISALPSPLKSPGVMPVAVLYASTLDDNPLLSWPPMAYDTAVGAGRRRKTIAWIGQAGDGGPGVGDSVIGVHPGERSVVAVEIPVAADGVDAAIGAGRRCQ